MSTHVKALVITGYGINCEREMATATRMAGADTTILHFQNLMEQPSILDDYDLLCFPGGFSFADELGAAKTFANRITFRQGLREQLEDFVGNGKCIIGICNGFQLLVKLGLLPGRGLLASLTQNESGRFENRWCHHKVLECQSIFTQGLHHLYLPVRHGEGRLVMAHNEALKQLWENKQVVLQYCDKDGTPTQSYPDNPNGSGEAIAGLCDPTGRILGLMAHPEAYVLPWTHPRWTRGEVADQAYGDGYFLFRNAIQYLETQKLTCKQKV